MDDNNARPGDVSSPIPPDVASGPGRPKADFEAKTPLSKRLGLLFPSPNYEEIARAVRQRGAKTSGQSVRRYFRGDPNEPGSIPSLEFFEAVCELTVCNSDWLLRGIEPMFIGIPARAAELAAEYGHVGRPVRVTAYKCWRCRGKVERVAQVCPHCAAAFAWEDFHERQEDALPV